MDWSIFSVIALVVSGFGIGFYTARFGGHADSGSGSSEPNEAPAQKVSNLLDLANSLQESAEETAHPASLLDLPGFQLGVDLLCEEGCALKDVQVNLRGENWIIACMAAEAMYRRKKDPDLSQSVLAQIPYLGPWPMHFALKYLSSRSSAALVGAVLISTQQWWLENRGMIRIVSDFITVRLDDGETPTFDGLLIELNNQNIEWIKGFMDLLSINEITPLREQIAVFQATRVDLDKLNQLGRVWSRSDTTSIVVHQELERQLNEIESGLREPPYRSKILIGDSGVGKTTLVKLLANRIQQYGWTLFEANAADVLAGQTYIGELERQVKEILFSLDASRRVLWYAPDFHEFLHTGSHRYDPSGVLDRVLPAIESQRVVMLGETTPEGYELLVHARRHLRSVMDSFSLQALSGSETVLIAQEWARQGADKERTGLASSQTVKEAYDLVKQYLNDKSAPGNLLHFLKVTHNRIQRTERQRPITIEDLITTLTQLTHLPQTMLDDRQELDIQALQRLFQARVVGQPDAIACLTERIAMLKAGLNDPSRPIGVFLFVGPTGTGKTEIAKTLSKFLFKNDDQLIRLDMSEFQSSESMDRILGTGQENQYGKSLVQRVRKSPFSVILLDEFEKAHPRIWDLFLQVFDDARLTDRSGNLTDFRHCIIILTSNLGAKISSGTNIGFSLGSVSFSLAAVEREVSSTFRPEFINRLDRVVVFHPLSQDVMRQILQKELEDTLQRRGFSKRDWAVEWDESAIEFFLHKGFTLDMGARPLKRAIERYLLSPLSFTIVQHEYPEGDQFLFITSDGSCLKVEFVDPDANQSSALDAVPLGGPDGEQVSSDIKLRSVALEAIGTAEELVFLEDQLELLRMLTNESEWQDLKQHSLHRTAAVDFWDTIDRFDVLSKIEVMDRIESGLRAAQNLMERLNGSRSNYRRVYPMELIGRLAEQLYLLSTACADFIDDQPLDAFILVEAHTGSQEKEAQSVAFFQQISGMYIQWAEKRRMRFKVMKQNSKQVGKYSSVLAVSGFGAFSILKPEEGLHLLEVPKGDRAFTRYKVYVRVAPQPRETVSNQSELWKQIDTVFEKATEGNPQVVRRYRLEPSPLVRDSVRHWRTGRLETVLDGNFDLMH